MNQFAKDLEKITYGDYPDIFCKWITDMHDQIL